MTPRTFLSLVLVSMLGLGGCATRPVNPRIEHFEPGQPYAFERTAQTAAQGETLVILAFSGGGTRAAAFAYGVLEVLRNTDAVRPDGQRVRLLDQVDVITGISGGSFTALAYGLYGEKLFDVYEKRFLKRNVQGELVNRTLNPANWGALSSTGWGRSELAANLYDEILFNGATYSDLARPGAPLILVGATDLASGSRLIFNRQNFDILCSDLGSFRLARAAAASSAVPVVLSPLTINNYGGTCGFREPGWVRKYFDVPNPPRPAARTIKRLDELRAFAKANDRPYLHLVDGGVSDNLGLRSVLDLIVTFEALHEAGQPTPLDHVRNIIVVVVNSLSTPANDWNRSEDAPGTLQVLVKAAGVPIDRYSGESVELLKDIAARWRILRELRDSVVFVKPGGEAAKFVNNAPDADIYPVDVSFPALKDPAERDYLNQLPTSFVLPDEAVDRLRAAAARIVLESPELQRLARDRGVHFVAHSAADPPPAGPSPTK
jgi:NTE family protein